MLHTKFRGNRPASSGEEDFWRVFTIYGHGGHLGHVTQMPRTKYCSPYPRRLHIKFDLYRPSSFEEEDVWNCLRRTTDDGRRTDADGRTPDHGYPISSPMSLWLRWAKNIQLSTIRKDGKEPLHFVNSATTWWILASFPPWLSSCLQTALEQGYKWKLSSCDDVKKSKQNSAKIIHRNTALKSTFSILLCNNSEQTYFSVCALGFQHHLRNPANVNARKNKFDPYITKKT